MHLLAVILTGLIIGALASAITAKHLPITGWVGNIIAGLVGSWLGESLFGEWGPQLAGIAILPALLGAIIFVVIVSLIMTRMQKPPNR